MKIISLISQKRYSNASQNSSEIWCEFRVCRVKALGGDRIANLVSEDYNNNNNNNNNKKFKQDFNKLAFPSQLNKKFKQDFSKLAFTSQLNKKFKQDFSKLAFTSQLNQMKKFVNKL